MTCAAHPAIETREHVLRWLARKFPSRSVADREDAAHEALCAVIRLGRPDGKREATHRAARALIGRQMLRGKSYSARSPATSIAGHEVVLDGSDGATVLSPDEYLDAAARVARTPDLDAAVDAAHWTAHSAADVAREALGVLRDEGLPWADVARLVTAAGRPLSAASAEDYAGKRAPADVMQLAEAALEAVAALDRPAKRVPKPWPAPVWTALPVLIADATRAAGSQVALARRLGVPSRAVRAWRDGDYAPSAERLAMMRKIVQSKGALAPQDRS